MTAALRESFDGLFAERSNAASHPNRKNDVEFVAQGVTIDGPGGVGAVRGGPQPKMSRSIGIWDDEDPLSPLPLALHSAQTFLAFINMCIWIAIASFQSSYHVGPSFLAVLALIVALQGFLFAAVLLASPFLYERISILRSLSRALRQIRSALIVNAAQVIVTLLLAMVVTISVNSGGCKDPSLDPNAALGEAFLSALGTFCRNKRAGAAFFYLTSISWIVPLVQTIMTARQIRKNPRSLPFEIPDHDDFTPPTAHHEQLEGHDEDETQRDGHYGAPVDRASGYRASGDYYERDGETRLFGEQGPAGYGEGGRAAENPFVDDGDQQRYDSRDERLARRREEIDPYEAIRRSMDHPRHVTYD